MLMEGAFGALLTLLETQCVSVIPRRVPAVVTSAVPQGLTAVPTHHALTVTVRAGVREDRARVALALPGLDLA